MCTSDRRLARWLDLVGELLRQPLIEIPLSSLNAELTNTFQASAACLHRGDDRETQSLWASPPDCLTPRQLEELRLACHDHPVAHWYRTTRSVAPSTTGRVPRSIADERCVAAWVHLSRPMGVTQQLFIPLHVGVEDHRTFVVVRPDRDFSDVDLALAHRLQPVLLGLERQVAELARRRAWRAKAQEAVDDLRLTERELVVLCLLSEGLTAAAIGRRLGIATATVHKHLQHVYSKLGAGDRLTAVMRAQRHGLLEISARGRATPASEALRSARTIPVNPRGCQLAGTAVSSQG